jgi:lipoprotein-anchoring transpeptidase ErfK/SrfK
MAVGHRILVIVLMLATAAVARAAEVDDAVLATQVALDRAWFSVGEIDGRDGANTRRALAAYQRAHDLPPTGTADEATRAAFASDAPALVDYTLTDADVAGPFVTIPADMMAKAKLEAMSYTSPLEAIAERAHASPKLLEHLNPGKRFDRAGEVVRLPNVAIGPPAPAARIEVDGADLSVRALDADGKVVARYPASVGSAHDPLPVGTWKIKGVARNPPFHYNPKLFWDAEASHGKAKIAPGPNNPVGLVWIDLSKEHYGIHGTPEPSTIGKTQSHGCIRVANWDAQELASLVAPGTPAILQD